MSTSSSGRLSDISQRDVDESKRDLVELFESIHNSEQLVESETQQLQVAGVGNTTDLRRLQVFVRVRPSLQQGTCLHAADEHAVTLDAKPDQQQLLQANRKGRARLGDAKRFGGFTRVFDASADQKSLFDIAVREQMLKAIREKHREFVFMAYGQTSAGKTYTIEGTESQPGILPQALELVFRERGPYPDVTVTYCEVYNKLVLDLLNDPTPEGAHPGMGPGMGFNVGVGRGSLATMLADKQSLQVMEDRQGRVMIKGLTKHTVNTVEEALALLQRGARMRSRAKTGMNGSSSRSHAIYTLHLGPGNTVLSTGGNGGGDGEAQAAQPNPDLFTKISFVDLAGSERQSRTGNAGQRLRESGAINESLSVLGAALKALCFNQANRVAGQQVRVPFRDSKLTHIFRDILHGYGQLVMCVNVSPDTCDREESINVLKYASMATHIRMAASTQAKPRVLQCREPSMLGRRVERRAVDTGGALPSVMPTTHAALQQQHAEAAAQLEELRAKLHQQQQELLEARCQCSALAAANRALQEEVEEMHVRAAAVEDTIREELIEEFREILAEQQRQAASYPIHPPPSAVDQTTHTAVPVTSHTTQHTTHQPSTATQPESMTQVSVPAVGEAAVGEAAVGEVHHQADHVISRVHVQADHQKVDTREAAAVGGGKEEQAVVDLEMGGEVHEAPETAPSGAGQGDEDGGEQQHSDEGGVEEEQREEDVQEEQQEEDVQEEQQEEQDDEQQHDMNIMNVGPIADVQPSHHAAVCVTDTHTAHDTHAAGSSQAAPTQRGPPVDHGPPPVPLSAHDESTMQTGDQDRLVHDANTHVKELEQEEEQQQQQTTLPVAKAHRQKNKTNKTKKTNTDKTSKPIQEQHSKQSKNKPSVSDNKKASVSDNNKASVSDNKKASVSDNNKASVSDNKPKAPPKGRKRKAPPQPAPQPAPLLSPALKQKKSHRAAGRKVQLQATTNSSPGNAPADTTGGDTAAPAAQQPTEPHAPAPPTAASPPTDASPPPDAQHKPIRQKRKAPRTDAIEQQDAENTNTANVQQPPVKKDVGGHETKRGRKAGVAEQKNKGRSRKRAASPAKEVVEDGVGALRSRRARQR